MISGLNQKVKRLNTEIDTWKARHELLSQQSAQDIAKQASIYYQLLIYHDYYNNCLILRVRNEQLEKIEQLNGQMNEYRSKISEKENEIKHALEDLERQKQEMGVSPSAEMKSLVEKLKTQLNEKEEQQRKLNQALNELKGDMVQMAKNDLTSLSEENSHEKRIRDIVEKTSAEYQDKIMRINEDLLDAKKQLKQTEKTNDELKLELEYVKSQLSNKYLSLFSKI